MLSKAPLNPAHDGSAVSTRHYMYCFDLLDSIADARSGVGLPDASIATLMTAVRRVRRIGGLLLTVVAALATCALIALILYRWMSDDGQLSDLGPEVGGMMIGAVATYILGRCWYRRKE